MPWLPLGRPGGLLQREVEKMSKAPTVTDAVCGMEIDTHVATETSEYNGRTYYFCSPGCKQKFDHAPQLFVGGPTINPMTAP